MTEQEPQTPDPPTGATLPPPPEKPQEPENAPQPVGTAAIGYATTAGRALRRYKNGKPLTKEEEIAVLVVFNASEKDAADFKRWLSFAASPVIDNEVNRIANLPVDAFNRLAVEAMHRYEDARGDR